MNNKTEKNERSREDRKLDMSSMCNKNNIKMSDLMEPQEGLGMDRDTQFAAFVNNRMNLLVMWAQRVSKKDIRKAKLHTEFFLHDMEHHFVDSNIDEQHQNAFKWLRAYVRTYPNKFEKRSGRAAEKIELIYDALGIPFRMPRSQGLDLC